MIKNIAYLAFFSAFVVIVWVVMTIIHNQQTSTITPFNQDQIIPINPTFDRELLEELVSKKVVPVDLTAPPNVRTLDLDNPDSSSSATITIPSPDDIEFSDEQDVFEEEVIIEDDELISDGESEEDL